MTMQAHHHFLDAADGTQLHVKDYLLDDRRQGGIVLMHGLGEHSGRYEHVADFFNQCGLSVRSYDHRGHGQSGGPRGDVPRGQAILQDAQIVVDDFADKFPVSPLLLGHSMGGLFAAHFALTKVSPLRGLILSSPALAIAMSGFQKMLLNVMSKVAPGFGVPNGLSPRFLSHDPAVASAYQNDPLVHPKISSRLLLSMLDAIQYCQSHASSLSIPTLMVVAGDDHLVKIEGSRNFFPQLPTGLATLHVYEHLYHEVFNEVEVERVFSDVRTWLTEKRMVGA